MCLLQQVPIQNILSLTTSDELHLRSWQNSSKEQSPACSSLAILQLISMQWHSSICNLGRQVLRNLGNGTACVSQEPLLLLQRVTTVGSLTPDHRLRETTPLLRPFCCCWNLSLHNNSMSIKPNDTPYLIKTTLVLIWEGSERRRSTVGCVPVP